jgi:NAD(P)-dependent dehydrogenase (short-subunit alcohol dehydrogenase family)
MSVSVITGGAGGIALACARRLADRGPVLLADLDEARLEAAAATLRGEAAAVAHGGAAAHGATTAPSAGAALGAAAAGDGVEVHVAVCDVSDPASVAALVTRSQELGPLGALVHTAGLAPPAPHDPRRVLDVNLAGTARVLDGFVDYAVPGSVAVCIASLAGHRAFAAAYDEALSDPLAPDLYDRLDGADVLRTYSISKRGVMLECRRRAAAWGAKGARIVSVSPGLVIDTSIGEAAATIHAGAYAEQSALKRAGVAADIAGAVAFLTSDAATYITGCDLLVDGGVVAHTLHHAAPADRERWNRAGY